jgi:putative Holliday junction resolvase
MSKIMALDLGDAWIGIAVTDVTGMFARPVTTVATKDIVTSLANFLTAEKIKTIIIGYPRTMRGGESDQTRKIITQKQQLALTFPEQEFILWDERLSSQRAQALTQKKRSQEEKLKEHARAAAFILDSYTTFLRAKKEDEDHNIDKL